MTKHIVTKDSLQAMIDAGGDRAVQVVGRALVVLFHRQTQYEKDAATTDEHNMVGFTGADGRSGVLTAKSFIKHGTLADWQLDRWTKKGTKGYSRIAKYWRQLDDEAKRKAATRVA